MSHRTPVITGFAVLSVAFVGGQALAQHSHSDNQMMMGSRHGESEAGHSHHMAMVHGGEVTMTPHHHFEVLFTDKQARVYVYDDQQAPINDLSTVKTTMTLMAKDGKPETMTLQYMAPDPEKGRTQAYFYAEHDMSDVKDGAMKATVKLMGLEKEPVEFRTAVKMGQQMSYVCPMGDSAPAEDPGRCPMCGMDMTMMEHGSGMGSHMDHHGGDNTHEQHH